MTRAVPGTRDTVVDKTHRADMLSALTTNNLLSFHFNGDNWQPRKFPGRRQTGTARESTRQD